MIAGGLLHDAQLKNFLFLSFSFDISRKIFTRKKKLRKRIRDCIRKQLMSQMGM